MIAWLLSLWSFLLPNQPPLAPMHPEGSFQENGAFATQLKWARPRNGEAAWDSGAGTGTGVLRSGTFRLPSEIHFASAGVPSHPGIRIYLLNETTKRTLDLKQRLDPMTVWRIHFWKIPADWQGATVRLVVEDNGTGESDWVGVTAPKAGGEPFVYSAARAAYRSFLLVFLALVFLLPGLAAALWVSTRQELDFIQFVTIVFCGSGLASYVAFWMFLAGPNAGANFSLAVIAASAVCVLWHRKRISRLPALRESAACLGLTMLLGVFFSAVGFLYVTEDDIGAIPQLRYSDRTMPPDNVLPYILAERLYMGESAKEPLVEFWRGSDRPPLQTGASLLVFKTARSLGSLELLYQMLSSYLQCLAIAGVWVLARAGGLGNRYLVPILGFVIFSELSTVHIFFVWPKMLAAGYVLLAMAPVFRGGWTMLDVVLSSTSLALGMLAHTAVLLTVIPFAVLVVLMRRVPDWKKLGVGLAALLILLLPWRWYQAVYDPPGDALLKFNMTHGQDQLALRQPFGQLLKESYANMSLATYFEIKREDVKTLFVGGDFDGLNSGDFGKILTTLERATFFHLFLSLGVVNAGFFCRIFCLFLAKKSAAIQFADRCFWMIAGSVLLWFAVLFQPGATVIHAWSLASVLILYMILVIYMVEGRPQLVYPLLALQALFILPLLIFAKPWVDQVSGGVFDAPLDFGMLGVALAALAGIVYSGWRVKLLEAS